MTKRALWQSHATAVVFALSLFGVMPAAAQQADASPLTVRFQNLTAAKDTARADQQPNAVQPGDTVRYVLTFANTQPRALRNIVFENPIPTGMSMLEGSVQTSSAARVEYSVDGGRNYAERPTILEVREGRQVRRAATPAEYTHIRWTVTGDVAAGSSVTARYDARVGGR